MNPILTHFLHQAAFGGLAAAGFGLLFNCPRRMIGLCFFSGALAVSVKTLGIDLGHFSLPEASFLAALTVAIVDRAWWQHGHAFQGSVLAVVGCIPLVPGSLAATGVEALFAVTRGGSTQNMTAAASILEVLALAGITLAAIGTALAIPTLVHPPGPKKV
jgi:uncharacterized membrane protein YjjB (DUF3815 family)